MVVSSKKIARNSSQFWQGFQKAKDWYHFGRIIHVGDGRTVRFWSDVWVGDCSLKILFPRLFNICSDQLVSVSEVAARGWCPCFRRNLGELEAGDWSNLQAIIGCQSLSEQQDRVLWQFEPKGFYSVRSLYRFIVDPGCRD
ncbi:hypothetical protein PVAP13_8KG317402 [Panicum virgatum]|uniref:Reverse transcriptase zinc-binding domain-containing protein n=1 Tax=Panicum virgatum TaxID=38727 RepID=A0A8T0PXP3_PANVG|nr:hypothetical protein PVAP13_8KG317402 [Panicum virgatum]